jgi:hypothetical protein
MDLSPDQSKIYVSSFNGETQILSSDLTQKFQTLKFPEGDKMRVSALNSNFFIQVYEKHPTKGILIIWDLKDLSKPAKVIYGKNRNPILFTNNTLLYFNNETLIPAPEETDMMLEKHPSHKGGKFIKRVKFTCHYLNLENMQEMGSFVLPEGKSNLILNSVTNASGTLGSVGFNDKCVYFFDSHQNFKRLNIDKLAGVIVSAKFWIDSDTGKEYYCFVPWTKYLVKVETSLVWPKK